MKRKYLTPKQKQDIFKQLEEIKAEITGIQLSENRIADDQILYFYQEIKKRIDFGSSFIESASMYYEMEKSKGKAAFNETK